jgi:hypothetical protein
MPAGPDPTFLSAGINFNSFAITQRRRRSGPDTSILLAARRPGDRPFSPQEEVVVVQLIERDMIERDCFMCVERVCSARISTRQCG